MQGGGQGKGTGQVEGWKAGESDRQFSQVTHCITIRL